MRSKEFLERAALPLLLTASLGVSACSGARPKLTSETIPATATMNPNAKGDCKVIDGLTGVRLIGASKEGGTNAVNSGECVGIYDSETLQMVGNLIAGAAFDIECVDGPKPVAFRIITDSMRGDVDLDQHLAAQIENGAFSSIPIC